MLQVIQTKSIDLLDTVVKTLESYDDLDKRPSYFADRCLHRPQYKEDSKAGRDYDANEQEDDDV